MLGAAEITLLYDRLMVTFFVLWADCFAASWKKRRSVYFESRTIRSCTGAFILFSSSFSS